MEDRGGRLAVGNESLALGNASRRADTEDLWASYGPEITMEDREDEVGHTRHVEFAEGGPKT